MEISGLPLHPLVVHAAVVFGPIGALTALAYAGLPRWRGRLRMPMLALALLATGSVVAAYLTGSNFLESRPELGQKAMVETHEARAELLLGLSAAAVLVQVVLTGDAGARAVWESL